MVWVRGVDLAALASRYGFEERLRSGQRLRGFGHRVFRGNDPRAEAMRRAMEAMSPRAGAGIRR